MFFITCFVMNQDDSKQDKSYSFYDGNIVLPRVKRLSPIISNQNEVPHQFLENEFVRTTHQDDNSKLEGKKEESDFSDTVTIEKINSNGYLQFSTLEDQLQKRIIIRESNSNSHAPVENVTHEQPVLIPYPPSQPSPKRTPLRYHRSSLSYNKQEASKSNSHSENNYQNHENINSEGDPAIIKHNNIKENTYIESVDAVSDDEHLIHLYKDYINKRFQSELAVASSSPTATFSSASSESEISVSSLSDSEVNDNGDRKTSFEPLYSLPMKNKDKLKPFQLDKIVLANNKDHLHGGINSSGSLPDLRSLDKFELKRGSHVIKNESEAESEPGAQITYRFRPLPPIPGTSSASANLYETLDGLSKKNKKTNENASPKHKSFRDVAKMLTLVPRLTTNSVRSRKNDHHLADISQYLPERKLKIFVGTWNMKGTKSLPDSLDDFLLPMESIYMQDVYVVGTQEGTPFRREWQVRLQETFGPSHVLMQANNFGVLQLSIFVRRELVWFCSSIEQDTVATRVGHKIKTKGALAMSFSIFGTSFLFITSHFTSDEGRLKDRINDYRSICKNIQLPYQETIGDSEDVTCRFDRVFWFGDFNFRVTKPRSYVDNLLIRNKKNKPLVIQELLRYDQLNDMFQRGKIFHGFTEAEISFMPTYKFDVNTSTYDTSSKKRVPSWTDRIIHKSVPKSQLVSKCYNSCNSIKVSDHRPVYAIFETVIEPYKSNFTVPGGNFDREIYVEANLRRSAPAGTQGSSHVCVIL